MDPRSGASDEQITRAYDERSCRGRRDDRCSSCSWHGRRLHTERAPRCRRLTDATRNWLCHWRRHWKVGASADSTLVPRLLSAAVLRLLPPLLFTSLVQEWEYTARATYSCLPSTPRPSFSPSPPSLVADSLPPPTLVEPPHSYPNNRASNIPPPHLDSFRRSPWVASREFSVAHGHIENRWYSSTS